MTAPKPVLPQPRERPVTLSYKRAEADYGVSRTTLWQWGRDGKIQIIRVNPRNSLLVDASIRRYLGLLDD